MGADKLDERMSSPTKLVLQGGSTLRWLTGTWGYLVVFGGVGFVVLDLRTNALNLVIGVATALWAAALFWPTRLEVHEDGVTVRTFLRRRFIPYTDLKRARGVQKLLDKTKYAPEWPLLEAFELELRDGSTITFPRGTKRVELSEGSTGAVGVYCPLDREHIRLAHEINTRVTDALERRPRSALAQRLARGGRAFGAWLTSLEGLARPAGGYRNGPDETAALFDVLEDRAAPRDARAAAAAVLRECVDESVRERMRVALEDDASPKLRAVVDTVLDGDAERDALLAALERASVRGSD